MKLFDAYKGLRKEMYIIFFGRVMTNLGAMIWPMMTMILSEKMNLSASAIADVLLIFSIVSLPIILFGGRLSDHFNKRNIIIVCDFISVIGYLICAFREMDMLSLVLIEVAALLQSVESPAYDALTADFSTPKDRDRAYSLMYFGSNLGLVLAPTISGILFNNYLWLAFLINAIAILSSTLLIIFNIRNVDKETDENDYNRYEEETDDKTSSFSLVFKNKVLLLYLLSSIVVNATYCQFNYLMPLDMVRVHGENGSVIYGTLTSVNCITVVLFTTFMVSKLRRVKEVDKMLLGGSLQMIGFIIFATLLKLPVFTYLALFVFSLGEVVNTIGSGPFQSKRIASNFRARISALIMVLCTLTQSLFNKMVGIIYDNIGSAAAWSIVILFCVIGLIINRIMKKEDRKQYIELYR